MIAISCKPLMGIRTPNAQRPSRLAALQAAPILRRQSTLCRVKIEADDAAAPASQPSTSDAASTNGKSELMAKIKSYGAAGTLSYVITELAFWAIALPGAFIGWHQSTGEWLSLDTDRAQLIGIAAAFVTGVRFAVPLRMGAALALIPTVKKVLDGGNQQQ